MISTLQRERKKMKRNLDGIRKMTKMPAAMVIVDPGYEHIAIKEAKKLKIPTICLIDTEGDPDVADIPIPGNDDSMRAIDLVLRELGASVKEGMHTRPEEVEKTGEGLPARERPVRRPPQAQPAPVEPTEGSPEAQA